jgi:hypothetical protein
MNTPDKAAKVVDSAPYERPGGFDPFTYKTRKSIFDVKIDAADGGQLRGDEAQHIEHGQRAHPQAQSGTKALLGIFGDGAPARHAPPYRRPAPGQQEKREGRAQGVAGQGHRADKGADLGRCEKDPAAQAGGQEGQPQGGGAL